MYLLTIRIKPLRAKNALLNVFYQALEKMVATMFRKKYKSYDYNVVKYNDYVELIAKVPTKEEAEVFLNKLLDVTQGTGNLGKLMKKTGAYKVVEITHEIQKWGGSDEQGRSKT